MSKESLEEVKRQFFEEGELSISGFEYLIAQAEEKIQLEERVKELEAEKGVSKNFEAGIIRENQRYKQALEFYADEENYKDMGIPAPEGIEVTNISEDGGVIARQALQGGNENE